MSSFTRIGVTRMARSRCACRSCWVMFKIMASVRVRLFAGLIADIRFPGAGRTIYLIIVRNFAMPTILAHIKTKPGKTTRFETILRELVAHTRSSEPNCLRYEYWRGAASERYYALLSFVDSRAFYEHQASE